MKLHLEFTRSPIIPPPADAAGREVGACLEFSGLVRETEAEQKIPGLVYEAYEPMARAQLEKIIGELATANPCDEIVLIHRLDFVPVGEASLFIRLRARRRKAVLALMDQLIDRLKADVPIWKRAPERA